jgi:serine/threonine protein kinase
VSGSEGGGSILDCVDTKTLSLSNNLYSWYSTRARNSAGFQLFEALLSYDPSKRLSAKQALDHPWFKEREPFPTANAFASLPNGNTIYPARKLIKDESDPKMIPIPDSVAHIAAGGGTSNIIPGMASGSVAGGATAHGQSGIGGAGLAGSSSLHKSSLNSSFLSAMGPSAPPPAPGSAGSAGPNSVGPHQSTSQQSTQPHSSSNTKGGLVAAATANAGRAAKRQKKA